MPALYIDLKPQQQMWVHWSNRFCTSNRMSECRWVLVSFANLIGWKSITYVPLPSHLFFIQVFGSMVLFAQFGHCSKRLHEGKLLSRPTFQWDTIYYAPQGGPNFWIYSWNPKVCSPILIPIKSTEQYSFLVLQAVDLCLIRAVLTSAWTCNKKK